MMTTTDTDTPRIYVASLSDYNAGTLHGVWIDADQDAETIHEEIQAMLAESPEARICQFCGWVNVDSLDEDGARYPHAVAVAESERNGRKHSVHPYSPGNAEEYAIHDHENFYGYPIAESMSIEHVAELAALIAEHGQAVVEYIANEGGIEYAGSFEENYCGEHDSEKDFAYQLADDVGLFQESKTRDSTLENYFDWDAWTRDLFMFDYWSTDSPNGVYVFRNS